MKNKTIYYLSFVFFISLMFTSNSLAKFTSRYTGNANIGVASFYIDGVYSQEFKANLANLSGQNENYLRFNIVNFNEDNNSEVALEYRIFIQTTNNIPLSFSLKNDGGENYIQSEEFFYNESLNRYESQKGILPVENTTHSYILDIKIIEDDKKYSYEIDAIKIIIEAIQKGD